MLRHIVIACALAGCSAGAGNRGGDGGGGSGGIHDLGPPGDGAMASGDGAASGVGVHISGTFTNDQGSRDWRAWIPSGYVPGVPIPLVVFLHGCAESIDHAEAATRLTAFAEQRTFIALYPAQSVVANSASCWNWFLAADQVRGKGEPSLIAGMTRDLMSHYTVDEKRVFVLGASAGGAMSDIMGATYPDLYAAIGVFFGCEYAGVPCSSSGGPDPTVQGQSAYQAMGSVARVVPTIVFHGDADAIAAPINGQQVTAQWVATDDWADDGKLNGSVPSTPTAHDTGQVPNGETWDRYRYGYGDGTVLVEYWVVHGMGHSWPGGDPTQTFTDAKGPDGTTLSYDFFVAHPKP